MNTEQSNLMTIVIYRYLLNRRPRQNWVLIDPAKSSWLVTPEATAAIKYLEKCGLVERVDGLNKYYLQAKTIHELVRETNC